MSLSGGAYEKSVKGGTKSKLAAPKPKYISHLLQATRQGDAAIAEVFRALQVRFKEPTWTIVFKALIVTHMLIRDGSKDFVLDYLANSHQFRITSLTSTGCSPMSEQGPNIHAYGQYLTARIKAFASVKTDYVRTKSDAEGQGRLRKLSVDKGLLRETESVQRLIEPLIKCKFLENEVDNDITLTAFRLLVADLLVLFQVANEGVINVLEHYFEMSKPDAERALTIYKNFVEQTDGVIVYMSLARSLESVTHLEIPNLQHAPTSLGNSLEEYVRDPDFEQNRIQYLAQKANGRNSGRATPQTTNGAAAAPRENAPLKSVLKKGGDSNPFGAPQLPQQVIASGNADLMDFFGSIEQPSAQVTSPQYMPNPYASQVPQTQPQMTGLNPYAPQPQQMNPQMLGQSVTTSNPYQTQAQTQYTGYANSQTAPIQQQQSYNQPQMTGANAAAYLPPIPNQPTGTGFGSYTPQSTSMHSSQFQTTSLQPQATGSNPFRKSMLPMSTGVSQFGAMAPQRTGGNPFSRGPPPSSGTPLFATNTSQGQSGPYAQYPQSSQMQNQNTGNPFGHNRGASESVTNPYQTQPPPMQVNMTGNMMPQQTGTSNPFRKSMLPMGTGMPQSYGGR